VIIAIDGPAASGKGTLAKKLAVHYGLPHLDTGLLYRAVAYRLMTAGVPLSDSARAAEAARSLDVRELAEPALKEHATGEASSVVSVHPEVRSALFDLQRGFAASPAGAVLDGRDIGTVICPDAEVKIFVVASPEVRAHRRYLELKGKGQEVDEAEVLTDIRRRDERDSGRATAPLKRAADAALLDTTSLDIDAAFRAALDIVEAVRGGRKHA
jgi:CMP/dCMP kinase